MGRFWKLILIPFVVMICIGAFYLQRAIANGQLPDYDWDTQSGDEQLLENVTIYGHPIDQTGAMKITKNDTIYQNELFFIERMNGLTTHPIIEDLIEDHRNFMRGKSKELNHFYEDEELLVSVEIESNRELNQVRETDFRLAVEVFRKDTKEVNSFSVNIPNEDAYAYISLLDIRVENGNLFVITNNDTMEPTSDHPSNETRVYRLNIAGEKLISEERLLSFVGYDNNHPNEVASLLGGAEEIYSNEYMAVSVREVNEEEVNKLIVVNLKTEEQFRVDLPKDTLSQEAWIDKQSNMLYFWKSTEGGLEITPYDLSKQAVQNTIEVKLPESTFTEPRSFDGKNPGSNAIQEPYQMNVIRIHEGNAYVLSGQNPDKTDVYLHVVRLSDGEVLYKGKLDNRQKDGGFEIYNMTIR
ncbi:hypothetical protein [Virgibacillus salexigens]|uniref:hypothetical protein n=1 Tax=Virgibacillus massiliensis TaxID=1462526 RepID=UPI001371BC07|nr:hypothetical protein [Virgibacillus massiliensis]MYL43299.1 hypothetical protein [Virgibacillus massiliensis]